MSLVQRKFVPDFPYAGDISARNAWDELKTNPGSFLVDVRTQAEWAFAGIPDLKSIDKQPILLSWKNYPDASQNKSFADQLGAELGGDSTNSPIFMICRTGARSTDAAIEMTNRGYSRCYNIIDGFEGPQDELGQRGKISGWKASNLPWVQS